MNRRDFLTRAGGGFGMLALASLLQEQGLLAADAIEENAPNPVAVRPPHFAARAQRVIFLFMGGGPSQVDTFDPKPELTKLDGQDVPESIARGVPRIARAPLRHLCALRGCKHDSPIHAPAEYIATTGTLIGDRPSLGSWLAYGLGSLNRNQPSFVVLLVGETGRPVAWSSGFLPSRYQGTLVKKEGIPNLAPPPGTTSQERWAQFDLIGELNRRHQERHGGPSDLDARIESY